MRRKLWLAGTALWAVSPCLAPQGRPEAPPQPQPGRLQPGQGLRSRGWGAGLEDLNRFNRLLMEARARLEGSLVRLEVEPPANQPLRPVITGVVVRPDVVVTTQEAVQGARTVFADILGAQKGYSALLEVRGSHRGVAVLQWVLPGPARLQPIRVGSSVEAPESSLVLFLDAGSPDVPGVALPAALVKLFPNLRPGTRERARIWSPLGLKGPALGPEDQGGLVCDALGRMVGIVQGRSRPFMVVPGEETRTGRPAGPGNTLERVRIITLRRAASLAMVIPVEQVLEAVEMTLAGPPQASSEPPPERPNLGITVDSQSLVILRVFLGTPAQRSGLQKGDRITHLDRQAVKEISDLTQILKARPKTGGKLEIDVVRPGREGESRLTLAVDLHASSPEETGK